jgi:hypothetical protein
MKKTMLGLGIISLIALFALTNYAYGMGSHHKRRYHNYSSSNSGGSTTTDNSGGNGATVLDLATLQSLYDSGSNSGGSTTTDNSGGNGATLQALYDSGSNSGGNEATLLDFNTTGDPVAAPEPATMLLIGSGLIGLWGARKKFKK